MEKRHFATIIDLQLKCVGALWVDGFQPPGNIIKHYICPDCMSYTSFM